MPLYWAIADWLMSQSPYDPHAGSNQLGVGEHLGDWFIYRFPRYPDKSARKAIIHIKDASVRWLIQYEHMRLPESGIELAAADPEFFPKLYRMLQSYNDWTISMKWVREGAIRP